MRLSGRSLLLSIPLWFVAAAYFSLGINFGLEWSDEGHVIYASWRTAEGAVPYRDFPHLYGPSLFFVNGALMRWFGEDLEVVRCSLVVVKASLAVLVFLAARLVASLPLALAAYALLVVIYGMSLFVFAVPYAQHYAWVLTFTGLLLVVLARRPAVGAASAGLCFGLATTFKQTTGVFAAIGLAWFLLYRRDDGGIAPTLSRALRIAALAASFLALLGYATKEAHAWTLLVLLGPPAAVAVLLARREILEPPSSQATRRAVVGLLACALGMAVPVAGYLFFYLAAGGLGRLADDLFGSLPWMIHWFAAFPVPQAAPMGAIALAGGLLASAWAFCRQRAQSPSPSAARAGAALLVVGAVLLLVARLGNAWLNLSGIVVSGVYWLPLLVVAAATPSVLGANPRLETRRRECLALFYFQAVVSLLFLSPNADIMHLLTALPIYLVLPAHLLDRVIDSSAPAKAGFSSRAPVAVVAAVILVVVALPFVRQLAAARAGSERPTASFQRASGIYDPSPKFSRAVELVEFLRDGSGRERPVAVIANEQMLYFLAAKRSPVERYEFLFFLIGSDVITPSDARASVDQAWVIGRLRQTKALIVDVPDGKASRRFHAMLPDVSAFLAEHYEPVARFGAYTVLDQRLDSRQTVGDSQ